VIDLAHGVVGCFGIVGGSIVAATGAALASQLRRDGGVAVAFFGDGATNQAYFHECLNFAGVRRLPAVYVCENNLYGEWTSMANVTAGGSITRRADAYAIPGVEVDGNDVLAVISAAEEAVGRARGGEGPTLLECKTYRHKGHSRLDDGSRYRPADEVREWLARDPIPLLAEQLDDAVVEQLEDEVAEEIDAAVAAARAAPPATPAAASAFKGAG
jgi:TPP-dependent pyruvate/acetoin dehydrogenase alpha subunit